jgi:hypothetical protein
LSAALSATSWAGRKASVSVETTGTPGAGKTDERLVGATVHC